MDQNLFNKFSDSARQVLLSAQNLATLSGNCTDTGHILLAILLYNDSIAKGILTSQEVLAEKV